MVKKLILRKNTDQICRAIRPSSWVRTYRVNPAGGTGIFTTINAAIKQANIDAAIQNGTYYSSTNGGVAGGIGPWNRSLILIDPGTYTEQIGTWPFIDYMGSTGNPEDVTIQYFLSTNSPVVKLQDAYMAHVTVKLLWDGVLRDILYENVAMSGHFFSMPDITTTYEDCIFITENPNSKAILLIPGDRNVFTLIGCQINVPGNQQALTIEANTTNRKIPAYITFIDCVATPGGTPAPIIFADGGGLGTNITGVADVLTWIRGSITPNSGEFQLYIQAVPGGVPGVYASGPNMVVRHYIDPVSITNLHIDPAATFAYKQRLTNPVLPVSGLSEWTTSKYLPSSIGTPHTISPVYTDTPAASTVTANRVYFIPVSTTSASRVARYVQTIVSGNTGKIYVGTYTNPGDGTMAYLWPQSLPGANANITPGDVSIAANYGKFLVIPGTKVWIGIVSTDSTAELLCSSAIEGDVFYADGFNPSTYMLRPTVTKLTSGLCPIPSLICD